MAQIGDVLLEQTAIDKAEGRFEVDHGLGTQLAAQAREHRLGRVARHHARDKEGQGDGNPRRQSVETETAKNVVHRLAAPSWGEVGVRASS